MPSLIQTIYEATKALSGTDALRALRRQDFDGAVVDLKMQEMEYGAFDYLTKPCEMDELMQKIREALPRGG